VHPTDRYLLGMQWKNEIYVDTALPFGLISAQKIFCALSDALDSGGHVLLPALH
jgi:hypothetical protein